MIDTNDLLINFLLFVLLPIWGIAGFCDWLCHRATRIESTSGLKESLMHSLMGVQLAMSGRYLGFFPEVSVREHLASGALAALKGVRTRVSFELSAITRERGADKRAVGLLIERVRGGLRQ